MFIKVSTKHLDMAAYSSLEVLPDGYSLLMEKDSLEIKTEDFIKKWQITEFIRFGRYHCKFGYTDYLNPEKSWYTLAERREQINKWLKELREE